MTGAPRQQTFTAPWIVVAPDHILRGGGLRVADGLVVELLAPREVDSRAVSFDEGALVCGLVNAHAHLELSHLAGRVPAGESFPDWIRSLLAVRARDSEDERRAAARRAADTLLGGGCTAVGDIDSSGLWEALDPAPLEVVRYREALDVGDAGRRRELLAELDADPELRALSPHAPYTVSDELAAALGERARARSLAVGIHFAETPEEREWLEHSRGPFVELLGESARRPALPDLDARGLIGERTALYHANDATDGELDLVAARGASIVHCPGTHTFFGREPFDPERVVSRGIPLALGTDSLASNDSLCMRRELRLCERTAPGLAPRARLELATRNAARAIGAADRLGTLEVGKRADFFHLTGLGAAANGEESLVEALVSGAGRVTATWTGGRMRNSP